MIITFTLEHAKMNRLFNGWSLFSVWYYIKTKITRSNGFPSKLGRKLYRRYRRTYKALKNLKKKQKIKN